MHSADTIKVFARFGTDSTANWQDCNARERLTFGLLQPAKNPGSDIGSLRKERSRLARRPFGGSFVIFTPFCNVQNKRRHFSIFFFRKLIARHCKVSQWRKQQIRDKFEKGSKAYFRKAAKPLLVPIAKSHDLFGAILSMFSTKNIYHYKAHRSRSHRRPVCTVHKDKCCNALCPYLLWPNTKARRLFLAIYF